MPSHSHYVQAGPVLLCRACVVPTGQLVHAWGFGVEARSALQVLEHSSCGSFDLCVVARLGKRLPLRLKWSGVSAGLCVTGEARRAEALAAILARQQEAAANVREAAERRRAAEAERLAQLEHRQRRKQEVQVGATACVVCSPCLMTGM
jgi:uncharacterized protein YaiL (DUF2058 family)